MTSIRKLTLLLTCSACPNSDVVHQLNCKNYGQRRFPRHRPEYVTIESTPGPGFQVDYYSTNEPSLRLREAIDAAGLSHYTVYHIAPTPLAELNAAQDRVKETVVHLRADSTIDPVNGLLIMSVNSPPDDQTRRSVEQSAEPVLVGWRLGEVVDRRWAAVVPCRSVLQDSLWRWMEDKPRYFDGRALPVRPAVRGTRSEFQRAGPDQSFRRSMA